MASVRIRAEDIAGIGLAIVAHVALLVWLVLRKEPEPPPTVQKVTVTLQGPIAAEAGSPSREEAKAAVAPKLAEEPAPPVATPAPIVPKPEPRVAPPLPRPTPRTVPAPAPRSQAPRPAPPPPRAAPPRPSRIGDNFLPPQPKGATKSNPKPPGGSRIGDNFLPGAITGNGKATTPPGPTITPQVRSSLASEVARQLKPRWQAPSGLDVDLLATTIEWDLNPDGTLAGPPRVTGQSGVNSANRSQADRHKEQALRAVRLAAPFRLPPQFYAGWQHLRFTFDRKLSQ
jgi:hypothetical protein